MKRKIWQRALSMLMSFVLIFGLLPIRSFADAETASLFSSIEYSNSDNKNVNIQSEKEEKQLNKELKNSSTITTTNSREANLVDKYKEKSSNVASIEKGVFVVPVKIFKHNSSSESMSNEAVVSTAIVNVKDDGKADYYVYSSGLYKLSKIGHLWGMRKLEGSSEPINISGEIQYTGVGTFANSTYNFDGCYKITTSSLLDKVDAVMAMDLKDSGIFFSTGSYEKTTKFASPANVTLHFDLAAKKAFSSLEEAKKSIAKNIFNKVKTFDEAINYLNKERVYYTDESYNVYAKAVEELRALGNKVITPEDVFASQTKVVNSFSSLVSISKDVLNKIIAEAKSKEQKNFTAKDWTELQKSIETAQGVLNSWAFSSYDQVKSSYEGVKKALDTELVFNPGTYIVPVKLMKAYEDNLSMGNNAVVQYSVVKINDDHSADINIALVGLKFLGMYGHVYGMKTFEDNDSHKTAIDTEVTKVVNYNDVGLFKKSHEFTGEYKIHVPSFTLERFIQIYVDAMDSMMTSSQTGKEPENYSEIKQGAGSQVARLSFDWANKQVSSSEEAESTFARHLADKLSTLSTLNNAGDYTPRSVEKLKKIGDEFKKLATTAKTVKEVYDQQSMYAKAYDELEGYNKETLLKLNKEFINDHKPYQYTDETYKKLNEYYEQAGKIIRDKKNEFRPEAFKELIDGYITELANERTMPKIEPGTYLVPISLMQGQSNNLSMGNGSLVQFSIYTVNKDGTADVEFLFTGLKFLNMYGHIWYLKYIPENTFTGSDENPDKNLKTLISYSDIGLFTKLYSKFPGSYSLHLPKANYYQFISIGVDAMDSFRMDDTQPTSYSEIVPGSNIQGARLQWDWDKKQVISNKNETEAILAKKLAEQFSTLSTVPSIDETTDETWNKYHEELANKAKVFAELSKTATTISQVYEAQTEFAKVYDKLDIITPFKVSLLADKCKTKSEADFTKEGWAKIQEGLKKANSAEQISQFKEAYILLTEGLSQLKLTQGEYIVPIKLSVDNSEQDSISVDKGIVKYANVSVKNDYSSVLTLNTEGYLVTVPNNISKDFGTRVVHITDIKADKSESLIDGNLSVLKKFEDKSLFVNEPKDFVFSYGLNLKSEQPSKVSLLVYTDGGTFINNLSKSNYSELDKIDKKPVKVELTLDWAGAVKKETSTSSSRSRRSVNTASEDVISVINNKKLNSTETLRHVTALEFLNSSRNSNTVNGSSDGQYTDANTLKGFEEYKKALDSLKEALATHLENPDKVNADALDKAYENLHKSEINLVTTDDLGVTDLNQKINEKQKEQTESNKKYTDYTFNNMLEAGKAVNSLKNTENRKEKFENAYKAIENLDTVDDYNKAKEEQAALLDKANSKEEKNYTPDSWTKLQDAINKVKELKDSTNNTSKELEAANAELNNAINNLVEKTEPQPKPEPKPSPEPQPTPNPTPSPEPQPVTPPDEKKCVDYEVPVRLANFDYPDKDSMGNSALIHVAKAHLNDDGTMSYKLTFKGIQFLNMYGHLWNLFHTEGTDRNTSDWQEAKIITKIIDKDLEGKDREFPQVFEITRKVSKEKRILARVWVDAMDAIMSGGAATYDKIIPGKGAQEVFIEFDWSKATCVNEEKPTPVTPEPQPTPNPTPSPEPQPTPNPTPSPEPQPTPNPLPSPELSDTKGWVLKDKNTGVIVSVPKEAYLVEPKLIVEINNDNVNEYKVTLSVDGKEMDPIVPVVVYLPVGEHEQSAVYFQSKDKYLDNVILKNHYVGFKVEHLGIFGLVFDPEKSSMEQSESNVTKKEKNSRVPKTGDSIFEVFSVVAILGLAYISLRKKEKISE